MPALAETQTPFLVRDHQNGLVPHRLEGEELYQYHIRLSQLYGLSSDEVEKILRS